MSIRRRRGKLTINTYNKRSRSEKNTIVIKKKGNDNVINVEQLEQIIKELSQHQDRKIKNLTGKLREKYSDLLNYVQALHGSHYYNVLRGIIQKYHHPNKKTQPYTIGSYLFGCLNGGEQEDTSCSPLCSGSIKDDHYGEDFCQYPVINADWDSGQRKFTFEQSEDDYIDSTPIVYVPFEEMAKFPGFSSEEKSWFRQKNFHKIYLRGTSDYMAYNNLHSTNQPVSINRIKSRSSSPMEINIPIENGSRDWILVGALIIFLILIGIFFWVGYRSSGSSYSPRRNYRYQGRYSRYRY